MDLTSESTWLRCRYFSFWHVPRTLAFIYQGNTFLLECEFDDDLDDYSPDYEVTELSPTTAEELEALSWEQLDQRRTKRLDKLPIKALRFDSDRKRLSGCFFARFQFVGANPF